MSKYQPIFDRYNAKLEPLLANPHNVHVLEVIPYHGTNGINTIVKLAIDRGINADGVVNTSMPASERMYERNVEIQRLSLGNVITVEIQAALIAALDKIVNKTLVNGRLNSAGVQAVVTDAAVRDLILLVESDVDFAFVGDENIVAVMVAKHDSLGFIDRVNLVADDSGNLDDLEWITSDAQVIPGMWTFPNEETVGAVGTVVNFQYTNENTERLRAKIGFHFGGVYSTKEVVVEPGSGEWSFEVPDRDDYPAGEFPIDFKYGIEDIVNGAWYLALPPFKVKELEWLKPTDNVVFHGVIHPNYFTPVHAAKYGETITLSFDADIVDRTRARFQVAGIGEPVEVELYPIGNQRVEFTLPAHIEAGNASKVIHILGEGPAPLASIYEFKIMNATVDESTLSLGSVSGLFANGMGGSIFYPSDALLDWTSIDVLDAEGNPLESGTANDVFPRTIKLTENATTTFEIRKAQSGAPNNYGFEVRLVDGAAITDHKDFAFQFTANEYRDNEVSTYLTGYAYVFPANMVAQVQVPQTGLWVNFADWDDAVTLGDQTELNIRLGATPETWTSVYPTVYGLVSATGEADITVDWKNGKILFGSPVITVGTEHVIAVTVEISPDGIGSFNKFNATLNVRRIAAAE